jgi:hypothetical protein
LGTERGKENNRGAIEKPMQPFISAGIMIKLIGDR